MSNFLFIKVDQGFPEHPQTVGLSDRAFRAVVELWCYCHRVNTDGKVPNAIFDKLPSKCKTELLAHYVEDRGDHYFMHNYEKEQQRSVDIEAKRRAGSLGGKAKAANLAKAQAESSTLLENASTKSLLDIDVDVDIEKERGASAPGKRSRAARPATFPAVFVITDAMKSWAGEKAQGIDLDFETEKFRNYHMAKGSVFKDWTAAWRTWMTKATEYAAAKSQLAGKPEWW